jgi:hypothetical protein
MEKRPGEWKLVKDAYSKAVKLANALNLATYPVPTPKASERKRITLAGKVMTNIGKGDLAALADPQFGDTPISTLISKVTEAQTVTQAEPESELLKADGSEAVAPDAFIAELQRWLGDSVLFAELLPMFDQATQAHADAGRAAGMAQSADELVSQAA